MKIEENQISVYIKFSDAFYSMLVEAHCSFEPNVHINDNAINKFGS